MIDNPRVAERKVLDKNTCKSQKWGRKRVK